MEKPEFKKMDYALRGLMPEERANIFCIKQHIFEKTKAVLVGGANSLAGTIPGNEGKKQLSQALPLL
jgi:hypothetical protein